MYVNAPSPAWASERSCRSQAFQIQPGPQVQGQVENTQHSGGFMLVVKFLSQGSLPLALR